MHPRGKEVLVKAQGLLKKTTDADELRILQAVVFPLVNGMSTEETARAIGRSYSWATRARNEFIRNAGIVRKSRKKIRNRALMTLDAEKAFLAPFFEDARQGEILAVSALHHALEQHLGRKVTVATMNNLLRRHGWRKVAPGKRYVAVDRQDQVE
jgi:transposase